MTAEDYGELAYKSYCLKSGGKSLVSGVQLPDWMALDYPIRAAWIHAASAVVDTVYDVITNKKF